MKPSVKLKFILILVFTISIVSTSIYVLDKIILPTVLVTCDAEMRRQVANIVNKVIYEEYSNNFIYSDFIHIQKDKNDKITMMNADTLKLNQLATNTVIKAQVEIKEIGEVGIKIPIGYLSQNNILSVMGPKITVKMQPIGYITSRYVSEFNSAGLNQTIHKISIETTTKIKIILPITSSEIEVINEIPICESVIVGDVPDYGFGMNLNK